VNEEEMGVMFMCALVCDVAHFGNTVRNVTIGLWLVGHPAIDQEVKSPE